LKETIHRVLIQPYVLDVIRDAEEARARSIETLGQGKVQLRLAAVCLVIIAGLMVVRFAGNESELKWVIGLLDAVGLDAQAKSFAKVVDPKNADAQLWRKVWWAAARVVGYGLVPLALAKVASGLSLRELGLGLGDLRKHAGVYLLLFAIMMPAIFAASFGAGFQAKYPYYKLAASEPLWPTFFTWELLYAANFAALEFFFRGFAVRALRPLMGYGSIFAMMIPYAMIHFGKPLPEAIGSVITGFVLGTLSAKHKSIWGGVFLHVSAACSMDFYALWHTGRL
jgi:uncharacterized protein